MDLAPGLPPSEMVSAVRDLDVADWSVDLQLLCMELNLVQVELRADEPLESAGGISTSVPGDDVELRENTLDVMAAAVRDLKQKASDPEASTPVSHNDEVPCPETATEQREERPNTHPAESEAAPVLDTAVASDTEREAG